jgi:hypothetical protein
VTWWAGGYQKCLPRTLQLRPSGRGKLPWISAPAICRTAYTVRGKEVSRPQAADPTRKRMGPARNHARTPEAITPKRSPRLPHTGHASVVNVFSHPVLAAYTVATIPRIHHRIHPAKVGQFQTGADIARSRALECGPPAGKSSANCLVIRRGDTGVVYALRIVQRQMTRLSANDSKNSPGNKAVTAN